VSGREEGASERSHEATPRRLEQARQQGDLPRSTDAQTLAAYLGFGAAATLGGGWAADRLGGALVPFLDRPAELGRLLTGAGAGASVTELAGQVGPLLLLFAGAPAVVILALLAAQRAIVVAPDRIKPKLARISPLENARNKFGPRGLVEFAKSAVKLAALGAVLAVALRGEADRLAQYARLDARFAGALLADLLGQILTGVILVAAAIAAFDLVWQHFDHLRRMRMSHEELKEESKNAEGDPHIRAQRRDRARQIANNRMLLAVPEADVVIANPTHYAVALKWERGGAAAPVCIAKGVDEIALAIRVRAEAAGVPVRTDPPAARSLHAVVEVGQEIRPEHYQAVAAAIIFADEMRRKARHRPDGAGGGRR
jgi:flagellar biosynthetic protein FlhB